MLATAAARTHDLPQTMIDEAKLRHRQAVVLHSVAVAIYDRRHRTLPLPDRRAGYTEAELGKLEPNPLLSPPAPPRPGPVVPIDPDVLWEAALQDQDDPYPDEDDPFGFGGGMEPPVEMSAPAAPHDEASVLAPVAPLPSARASADRDWSDNEDPFGYGGSMDEPPRAVTPPPPPQCARGPGVDSERGPPSGGGREDAAVLAPVAPPHPPAPQVFQAADTGDVGPAEAVPESEVEADPDAAHRAIRTSDRRTALTSHLSRQTPSLTVQREAHLLRSMRALQSQCADLSRTMAEVRARQGPLVQRLYAAQSALTNLSNSPATAGSAAVQALHATLSQALQAHRAMQPAP